VRIETHPVREATQVETVAAAGIQNHIARNRVNRLRDSTQQWIRHTTIVQTPPRRDRLDGIARVLGSPILRLQQVDVPATCDVERMSPPTNDSPVITRQCQMAIADRAEEHDRL
jgi:hypothetical protein